MLKGHLIFVITTALLSSIVAAETNKARLKKQVFPEAINLAYEIKPSANGTPMSDRVTYELNTLPEMSPFLNNSNRTRISDLLKTLGRNTQIYAYKIQTPGVSGNEKRIHSQFAKQLMDLVKCNTQSDDRNISSGVELVFGQTQIENLTTVAAYSQRFFNDLFETTRLLGKYDQRNYPYYYPRFKSLIEYVSFTCHKTTGYDEDGVRYSDIYQGLFIGDFHDFSENLTAPPLGLGANQSIGYLVLVKR